MSGVVSLFKPAFIYTCMSFHYLKNGAIVASNSDFLMHEEFAFGNADGFHEVGVSTEPDACAALLEIIA